MSSPRPLKNLSPSVSFSDLSDDHVHTMLKIALQMGMISSEYHYIVTSLDLETLDLSDFQYNRVNVTAFRLVNSDLPYVKVEEGAWG